MIFRGNLKGDLFQIGKKTSKKRSVFLHKNVQHAGDEWWISWRVGQGGWVPLGGSGERLTIKVKIAGPLAWSSHFHSFRPVPFSGLKLWNVESSYQCRV